MEEHNTKGEFENMSKGVGSQLNDTKYLVKLPGIDQNKT